MGSRGGRFWRDMENFEQVCLKVKLGLSMRDKLKEKQPLEGRQASIIFFFALNNQILMKYLIHCGDLINIFRKMNESKHVIRRLMK